jgi:VWFA-related protein
VPIWDKTEGGAGIGMLYDLICQRWYAGGKEMQITMIYMSYLLRRMNRLSRNLLFAVLLLMFSAGAHPAGQAAGKHIYVVAVHDSSLFTLCPVDLRNSLANGLLSSFPPPFDPRSSRGDAHINAGGPTNGSPTLVWYDGTLTYFLHIRDYFGVSGIKAPIPEGATSQINLPPPLVRQYSNILDRRQPDWQKLSRLVTGVNASGWVDPVMASEIETEFSMSKDYILVDSAEKADVIFLAEGIYLCCRSTDGARQNYTLKDDFLLSGGKELRSAAIAVVVPAEIYRKNPANADALLAARLWAGIATRYGGIPPGVSMPGGIIGSTIHADLSGFDISADPKDLVKQYIKKAPWPNSVAPVVPARVLLPLPTSQAVSKTPAQGSNGAGSVLKVTETAISSEHPLFQSNTTLVTVPVIARDANGRCVSGLGIGDFHVYEDDILQDIDRVVPETAPFQMALMMDISRSAALARSSIARAATAFASGMRQDDSLMVLAFNQNVIVESELTSDRDQLRRAIAQADKNGGGIPYYGDDWRIGISDSTGLMGTRLYDAVDLAVTERFDKLAGRKAILIITDGIDTGSRLATLQSTLARIEESNILVYTILSASPILDTINRDRLEWMIEAKKRGSEYLAQLAVRSGGRVCNTSTDTALKKEFSDIAEELSHQYTLCYYPKKPVNSTAFRRIQVKIEKPDITIRTRAGYRPVPAEK